MRSTLKVDAIEALPTQRASDLKTLGWRGVMNSVRRQGKVVVTNHNQPEAVIIAVSEYQAIVEALTNANRHSTDALEMLRQRFDARLASLASADAGQRLRELIRSPADLDGQVKPQT